MEESRRIAMLRGEDKQVSGDSVTLMLCTSKKRPAPLWGFNAGIWTTGVRVCIRLWANA